MSKKYFIFFFIIIIIASFFRLWKITTIPGGLFPDEAANGLDIVEYILKGHHSPFFERGLGREALFFYLQTISVLIFGIGVWQMHLVSAIIGILTVVVTWFLAKNLFNTRVAFLTSFFLATSTWHTTLSRTGFRAIMVPLMTTLFFLFVTLAFKEVSRKKRIIFTVLAGISLGLGFYTYISYRAMFVILPVLLVFVAIFHREIFKKYWKEMIICLIVAILVMSPLIFYFLKHPWSFIGRAAYVSIFNKDQNKGDLIGTFLEVAKKTFLMFFIKGDLNWRHNVSGYSMLNPLVAAFFGLGILYSILTVMKKLLQKNSNQNYFKHLFLIIWFLGMIGPALLSVESIPHGLRSIGTMPSVFFFPAIMLNFFYERININRKKILNLLFGLILILSFIYNYYLYFGISANSPDFYYAYRSDLTVVSNYLNQRNLKEKTYLVLDEYSVQTPQFLTSITHQPYILLDPATSYQIELKPGDQIIFTQSTMFDIKKFVQYHPDAKIIKKEYNQFNQEIMRVYEQ